MKNQKQILDILNEYEHEKKYFENCLDNFNKLNVSANSLEIVYLKSQIKNNESQINLLKWVLDNNENKSKNYWF